MELCHFQENGWNYITMWSKISQLQKVRDCMFSFIRRILGLKKMAWVEKGVSRGEGQWMWSKCVRCMYGNRIMKPIKIVSKRDKKVIKRWMWSKHIICMHGHITWNPVVQLLYNKNVCKNHSINKL
jgi:hypothetical protein